MADTPKDVELDEIKEQTKNPQKGTVLQQQDQDALNQKANEKAETARKAEEKKEKDAQDAASKQKQTPPPPPAKKSDTKGKGKKEKEYVGSIPVTRAKFTESAKKLAETLPQFILNGFDDNTLAENNKFLKQETNVFLKSLMPTALAGIGGIALTMVFPPAWPIALIGTMGVGAASAAIYGLRFLPNFKKKDKIKTLDANKEKDEVGMGAEDDDSNEITIGPKRKMTLLDTVVAAIQQIKNKLQTANPPAEEKQKMQAELEECRKEMRLLSSGKVPEGEGKEKRIKALFDRVNALAHTLEPYVVEKEQAAAPEAQPKPEVRMRIKPASNVILPPPPAPPASNKKDLPAPNNTAPEVDPNKTLTHAETEKNMESPEEKLQRAKDEWEKNPKRNVIEM